MREISENLKMSKLNPITCRPHWLSACAGLLSVLLLSACGAKSLGLGSDGSEVGEGSTDDTVDGGGGSSMETDVDETSMGTTPLPMQPPTMDPTATDEEEPTPPPMVDPTSTSEEGEANPLPMVDPTSPGEAMDMNPQPTPMVPTMDPTGTGEEMVMNPQPPSMLPTMDPAAEEPTPSNMMPSMDPTGESPEAPLPNMAVMIPLCGNGVVDEGEECDLGESNGSDGCSINCVVEYLDGGAGE